MAGYEAAFKYKLIYIMVIHDADHDGYLKIGDATLASSLGPSQLPPNCELLNTATHERIKQYTKTALTSYELLYTELALRFTKMADGTSMPNPFRDEDIHDVLARSGYPCKRFPDTDRDSEWYAVNLETAINAIKAYKEGRTVLSSSEKVCASTEPGHSIQKTIELRQEQKEAVERTIQVFHTNDRMLWDCKMRFGKTVSAYELIRKAGFQKTIVVTHRPVVEEGWQKDHDLIFGTDSKHIFVTKKINGSSYEYDVSIDSENDRILRNYARMGTYFAYFASMQDLRGSKRVGGKFDKNNAVFEIDWDLIIYDEAHEGTQTDLGQTVQALLETPKNGKAPKILSLSGTPYNLIGQYEENVYTWDYVMEQRRKREFAEQYPDLSNPYTDLPEMRIYTFDLSKTMPTAYRYETEDMAFNFREFFRTWTGDPEQDFRPIPAGAHKGEFVHEADVRSFLDLITQESEDSHYPFSNEDYRDMFRHTFWMVPGVKEARALSKLLKEHPVFQHFCVANVAGEGDKEEDYDNALAKVQNAIKNYPYTITISCGRLTTGVTVPEWSAVMMLSGSASTAASGYMQTVFRVQSVGSVNGKQKELAYVFDFAPDRALKVLSEVHTLSRKGKTGDSDSKAALGEFLNFCPVIAIGGTQMLEYDVPKMMRQIKKITVDKAIKSGFDDESIYNEGVGIIMDDADVNLFNKLASIIHGQPKAKLPSKVTINRQGLTGEEYQAAEKAKSKPKRERSKEDLEAIKKQQEMKKEQEKVIRLLRAVSIRLPMLIYGAKVDLNEDIHIGDFVDLVDDESWVEFMPDGVTKPLFKRLLKYYDEDVVVGAGLRIRRMAKAADELPPTRRVQRIAEIFSLFRNPDKETVLTPWRVVNMHMGDILGGYNFYAEDYPQDGVLDEPRLIDNGDVTSTLFLDQDTKILEMNSKSGLYPLYLTYSLYAMKLPKPEAQMELDETQRIWQETLDTNIFVLCKTPMAVNITRRTLAGYQDDWAVHAVYIPRILDRMEDKPRLARKLSSPKTWMKEGERLKFDAVVGNPPYQLMGGSGGTNDAPIYQHFAELAAELNPAYISLIIPSRWFSTGRENLLSNFRNAMLTDRHISKMVAYTDSRDIFPTVEVKGGLCYYLRDEKHLGDCEYSLVKDGQRQTAGRNLGDFDILIREPRLADIVKKVMMQVKPNETVDTIVSNDTPFGIPTNPHTSGKNSITIYPVSSVEHDISVLYLEKMARTTAYVSRGSIKKNTRDIDKHKVFIPEAAGSGNDPYVVGKPEYAPAGSVCSQTFLYVPFETEQEAHNFISYLRTKFFRILVSACKISQHTPSKNYRFVPLQDFTKSWIDVELYEKYELTDEEIKFIETTIKPME